MLRRPWLTWAALSLLAWGSIAAIAFYSPWHALAPRPLWLNRLEFTIFPVIGWTALVAPLVVAVAVAVRRWMQPALLFLAAVATAQALVAIVEFATPPAELPPYLEIHKG